MKKLTLSLTLCIAFTLTGFAQQLGTSIGKKAPELIGTSPSGETLKLSDLKGKMVLLDFWASWCGPCRRENPIVVAAYNNFKDKKFKNGKTFTVFSVSLDKNPEAWARGIAADKLTWPYHIGDMKGWNSKFAAIYGVRRIPSNFLIDGNGIILEQNVRGPRLEAALKKYLK
ncbi:MAG: alkyl hydroperoxide reductase [Draconibacterium sp.]|nr:MAG: alkyl hydroperoxide reductase [Draconibacterium sp.]